MSNADVPYLSMLNIIDNPKNPFTGNPVSTETKNKPLYVAISGNIARLNKERTELVLIPEQDYLVHTDIFNPDNWKRADE